MRAFLVAAKVADCGAWETVDRRGRRRGQGQACRGDTELIWAQAPQTTALKRRFFLSQSLVHNARERMRRPAPSVKAMPSRLGKIFLTGHLKNGAALSGLAVVEVDPWRVTPVGPSTLRRPAVRLPTSKVGLRLRQNPAPIQRRRSGHPRGRHPRRPQRRSPEPPGLPPELAATDGAGFALVDAT